MRIETMTVKLLRSGKQYSNDVTELRVSLDDGDDWKDIERALRWEAAQLIDEHWREQRQAEEESRQRRIAKQRDLRDEHIAALGDDPENPCGECPAVGDACDGCKFGCPY